MDRFCLEYNEYKSTKFWQKILSENARILDIQKSQLFKQNKVKF